MNTDTQILTGKTAAKIANRILALSQREQPSWWKLDNPVYCTSDASDHTWVRCSNGTYWFHRTFSNICAVYKVDLDSKVAACLRDYFMPECTPRNIVNEIIAGAHAARIGDRIIALSKEAHPDWWAAFTLKTGVTVDYGDVEAHYSPGLFKADSLFYAICSAFNVDKDSEVGRYILGVLLPDP